jgi:hypothetical protein
MALESDLYRPVKALLEGQGYSVKGEVLGCDVVAVRGKEPPVIVELKRTFGIGLVLQGVNRLTISDTIYLAVGTWPKKMRDVRKLCRRLGFGLMYCSIPVPTSCPRTSAVSAGCWASTHAVSGIPISAARRRRCH